jgi:SecDF, P1 head subdomain
MLDHDERLPEEQAYPDLIQELRTIYHRKPEELQVLSRVHQHLAADSHPLPLSESAQADSHTQPRQSISVIVPLDRPPRLRERWLQALGTVAAVLLVGLLIGSFVFAFSIQRSSVGSPANSLRIFLVPAEKGRVPSQIELEAASTLLSQRFSNFGLQGVSVQVTTSSGQSGILVELPRFGGNEQQTIGILAGTGELAFWGTGDRSVPIGTTFDPSHYARYNPGDQPHFTGQDLDTHSLAVTKDDMGNPQIEGMMKGDAVQRFQLYTAQNIGTSLTITLDEKVLESPVIESSISGPFIIGGASGEFTQQQARAIVAALKSGALPVALAQQT